MFFILFKVNENFIHFDSYSTLYFAILKDIQKYLYFHKNIFKLNGHFLYCWLIH